MTRGYTASARRTYLIRRGRKRAELYERLLTADPPICRGGHPVAVLNACERRRRGADCLCRFDANELAEDGELLGCGAIADSLEHELEREEVEGLLAEVELCLNRPAPTEDRSAEAFERLGRVRYRLEAVVEHEAGLTDRYSDEIEP